MNILSGESLLDGSSSFSPDSSEFTIHGHSLSLISPSIIYPSIIYPSIISPSIISPAFHNIKKKPLIAERFLFFSEYVFLRGKNFLQEVNSPHV